MTTLYPSEAQQAGVADRPADSHRPTSMTLQLTRHEAAGCAVAASIALGRYGTADSPQLHAALPEVSRQLPPPLIDFLTRFRRFETAASCVVSGYSVDSTIGDTPAQWQGSRSQALVEEIVLLAMSCVLGEPFSWATLQDGRIVQDLMPVRSQETTKSGNSSASVLDLHTEDAFDQNRCDYLGLMCLRNNDAVPTVVASVDHIRLSDHQRRVLSEPRFTIAADPTHLSAGPAHTHQPPPITVPILFGDQYQPYLRTDGYFTRTVRPDPEAAAALDALSEQLERAKTSVVLAPGDIFFIDNYRAVHGRGPFKARYDGQDRWLKRVNITRDLRKSRHARPSTNSPVVSPTFPSDPSNGQNSVSSNNPAPRPDWRPADHAR